MSRICVKNLPKYVAEDRLREVFSQKGEITDAKLMRTKDGKSRQFAFIGFRTEQEAQEAIKYFNKSFLDTCRIACEIARKVGDPDIPRPWSRYSVKKDEKASENKTSSGGEISSQSSLKHKGKKKDLNKTSEDDDPQLQEFLQVMQPRVNSKLWANDALVASVTGTTNEKGTPNKEDREKTASAKVESENLDDVGKELGGAPKSTRNLALDEVVSDMDYFKSRVKKGWSDSESSEHEDSNNEKEDGDDSSSESSSDEDDQAADSVREHNNTTLPDKLGGESPLAETDGEQADQGNPLSSLEDEKEETIQSDRLFVRNLPYTTTEEDLEELFSKCGKISEVHLVVDKDTRRSKGIAYIQYAVPESAARALEEVDNSIFQGRLLHVMPAQRKGQPEKQNDHSSNQAAKTFKQQREEERKASEASGDTRAWNTLFMRSDTVVENIARKFGVSKSDFLEREADDLAVRIALGETQVINETKKALAEAGVNVAALEEFAANRSDSAKRSNHVLLVKNLPYGCSGAELANMFGKYGSLDQVILPPTKTMALVVFLEPSEARAAFKGLAYKRYKDAPLYLEWAPGNILNPVPSDGNQNNGPLVGDRDANRVLLEQHAGLSDVDIDPDRTESRSLFVKNLNFKTTNETLRDHLSGQMKNGKILSVKIKQHMKNGKHVSMGFGFVEFDSVETATNICQDLQGTVLDGHALVLQHCQVKKEEEVSNKAEKDKSSTKLLVRNVAFEATEKDLRKLFSPFGKIKSLRLPMKFGSHRGFAFVEFVTKQEAQNALKALSNTHLYGRHLVLERAKEGESLEELRARTAAQFTDEQNGYQNPAKLSRKRKHMAVLDEGRVKFERIAD
ncbi:multiple RNA-binding domain-containing protein 1 [Punica granatum]|uniref:Multiple RNA-binding domain-containing protein 1 n=1 Tax=Punica granatum TaxID=22663 RepID=A0A6P8DYY9_PUNGR|nr:multiple RNA-binding domain-containing protein 1 [Punica granatum]